MRSRISVISFSLLALGDVCQPRGTSVVVPLAYLVLRSLPPDQAVHCNGERGGITPRLPGQGVELRTAGLDLGRRNAAREPPIAPGGHAMQHTGAPTHKRELTALSRCPTPTSCRFWSSVRTCTGSLFQPGSHGGFLTPPTPWTTAEKAVQTGEARLEAGPPTTGLVPAAAAYPAPARSPTNCSPRHSRVTRWRSTGAAAMSSCFALQCPGNQERPDRSFDTCAVLAAYLVEPQQLFHFFLGWQNQLE